MASQKSTLALAQPDSNTRLYIVFADEDKSAFDSLLTHLSVLEDNYNLQIWHKDRVLPGADMTAASQQELQQAHIVLLFVSSHLLAADWFGGLKAALKKLPDTKVLPIIVRACAWQEDPYLSRLKVLPANHTPLMNRRGATKDEAFLEVTNGIKSLIAPTESQLGAKLGINKPARFCKLIRIAAAIVSVITAIGFVIGFYVDSSQVIKDWKNKNSETEQTVEAPKKPFTPIFRANTADTFNVLVVRFEDYVTKLETECIGRSILEHLNVIKEDKGMPLALYPIYVHDSISPPKDKDEALRIQKRHNADLIIYGLAKMEEQCTGADICFRYAISQEVVRNIAPEIEEPIAHHEVDYVRTSPMSIQEGKFKVDSVLMKVWVSALMNVKAGREEAAFVDLYKLGDNDTTLPKETRSEKFFTRGNAFFQLGKYTKAIEAYDKTIELNSQHTDAYNKRGIAHYSLKTFDKAIRDYDKAIELNPRQTDAYNNRGLVYGELKVYDKAIRDYDKAIELNPDNPLAYNNRGIIYWEIKTYDNAIRDFDKAIELNPDNPLAYNNRGLVYGELKVYDKAIRDFDTAIAMIPKNADVYNNRGLAHAYLKAYDKVIIDFSMVIKLNHNDADAYNNRGVAYNYLKAYDQAIRDFDRAIALNPEKAYVYQNRGLAYANLKAYNKAIRDFDKAIELNPQLIDAYNNRGNVFRNLKANNQAIRDYDKAIDLYPEYADAYYNRGLVYFDTKDYDKAVRDFKKVLGIHPLDFGAFVMINRIYIFKKYWYLTLIASALLLYIFRKLIKVFFVSFFKKKKKKALSTAKRRKK